MRCLRSLCACALLLALTVFSAGCGGTKHVPVTGQVTVGGQPLKSGTVTYHPDKEAGNTQPYSDLPHGTVDENGKYTLATGGKPGAPAGKYKVTVASTVPSNPKDPYSLPKHLTDKANAEVSTTSLTKEVKADAPAGHYDIPLTK
jgi:hypothetical protein